MEIYKGQNIILMWISWQFYEMPKFLFEVWNNYFMFAANYYSVPMLLKTFFAPWRRYRWKYPKGFQVGEFLTTLLSNFFSRFLGALMRIVLIITGIVLEICITLAGAFVIIAWTILPFIVIFLLLFTFLF